MLAKTNRMYSYIEVHCTSADMVCMLRCLDMHIVSQAADPSIPGALTEMLDTLRYQIRLGYHVDGHVCIPFVIAFFMIQIVKQHIYDKPLSPPVNDDEASLMRFFSAIDNLMSEVLGIVAYQGLLRGKHQDATYMYYMYLNHLYQCHSPRLSGADKKDLLLHLFSQLYQQNDSTPVSVQYQSGYVTICTSEDFDISCQNWMDRNKEDDIFLDEILVDAEFISRGHTWRLLKPDRDTVHRCAQCVLGPQDECITRPPLC